MFYFCYPKMPSSIIGALILLSCSYFCNDDWKNTFFVKLDAVKEKSLINPEFLKKSLKQFFFKSDSFCLHPDKFGSSWDMFLVCFLIDLLNVMFLFFTDELWKVTLFLFTLAVFWPFSSSSFPSVLTRSWVYDCFWFLFLVICEGWSDSLVYGGLL